jgi:hypothetical protein
MDTAQKMGDVGKLSISLKKKRGTMQDFSDTEAMYHMAKEP